MGCTNSKERPRTPPPDAALQNVVSDGDGFWAANGETRASREATPLKAAADPFQTVDLTNPETAAAASAPATPAEEKAPDDLRRLRRADGAGARPRRRLRRRRAQGAGSRRSGRHVGCATRLGRQRPGGHDQQRSRRARPSRRRRSRSRRRPRSWLRSPRRRRWRSRRCPSRARRLDRGRRRADPRDDDHGPARAGVTIKNAGGFSLAEARRAAPPTSPVAAIPEAFTAAFGAPPTPVVKQEAESWRARPTRTR